MALRSLTLDRLLFWVGCGILVIFFLPLSVFVLWQMPRMHEKALVDKSKWFADQLAESLVDPVLTRNEYSVGQILQRASGMDDHYCYALHMNSQKTVEAHTFEKGIPEALVRILNAAQGDVIRFQTSAGPVLDVSSPILGGQLGHLHLGVLREEVIAIQRRIVWTALAMLASALVVLLTGTRFVALYMSRPLSELEKRTRIRFPSESAVPPAWKSSGTVEVQNIASRFLVLLDHLKSMESLVHPSQRSVFREKRESAVSEILHPSTRTPPRHKEDIWSEAYLEDRYAWLVFHRWIAIVGIILALLIYQAITERYASLGPSLALILILAAWNGFLELRNRWSAVSAGWNIRSWLMAQILLDLLALTSLLHLYGGIENPFKILYVFLVVIAALMFPIKVSGLIAMVGTLLYGGLILSESKDWLPHHSLFHVTAQDSHGVWKIPFIVWGDVLAMALVQVGVVFFIHAVSKRRREAEAARKAAEEVALSRERMAILGELSAGVAHEIRNPIHGLLNCLDLLRKKTSSDGEVMELTALLDEGLQRISVISDRLLRMGHARPTEKGFVDLQDMTAKTVGLVRETARRKGVTIECHASESLPVVWGDADRLSEALLNLLTNSLDACDAGARISVRLEPDLRVEGMVKLVVSDSGAGIPPDVLHQVFNPFFTTKSVGQGSGLGLSLVRETARLHGGSVDIASSPGRGTTVTMNLSVEKEKEDGVMRSEP